MSLFGKIKILKAQNNQFKSELDILVNAFKQMKDGSDKIFSNLDKILYEKY